MSKIKVLLEQPVSDHHDPLLLLDGVPVSMEDILNFSPYKIQSIGVINERYFIGPLIVDGIVCFQSFGNKLHGFKTGENVQEVAHQGLDPLRFYKFPDYSGRARDLARIPDYRDQLCWNPQVRLTASSPYTLEFYTSDTLGKFEISIEGYTQTGDPVSIRKYLEVKRGVNLTSK